MSGVKFRFQRFGLRPPPFVDVLSEVELENNDTLPLWFLLPLYLDHGSKFGDFLASAMEISQYSDKSEPRVARFLGNGSFQLIRLAPGAQLRIKDFPITLIGKSPKTEITVPVIVAEHLTIGDLPAENWLPVDLTFRNQAEVSEEASRMVASRDTPGAIPIPVTPSGIRTLVSKISLM